MKKIICLMMLSIACLGLDAGSGYGADDDAFVTTIEAFYKARNNMDYEQVEQLAALGLKHIDSWGKNPEIKATIYYMNASAAIYYYHDAAKALKYIDLIKSSGVPDNTGEIMNLTGMVLFMKGEYQKELDMLKEDLDRLNPRDFNNEQQYQAKRNYLNINISILNSAIEFSTDPGKFYKAFMDNEYEMTKRLKGHHIVLIGKLEAVNPSADERYMVLSFSSTKDSLLCFFPLKSKYEFLQPRLDMQARTLKALTPGQDVALFGEISEVTDGGQLILMECRLAMYYAGK